MNRCCSEWVGVCDPSSAFGVGQSGVLGAPYHLDRNGLTLAGRRFVGDFARSGRSADSALWICR